jgi:hypothetical protein
MRKALAGIIAVAVSFALAAPLCLARRPAPVSTAAASDDPTRLALARYVANKLAQKQNAAKDQELKRDLEGTFNEIRRLRMATKAAKEQGPCDVCEDLAAEYCNRPALYPEFCRDDDCHVDLKPKRDLCYRVYRSESCYKTLTASARAKVNECWLVDNHLEVKELETEIDNLKKQLDDVVQELYDLRKEELALEEECPRCSKMRVPAELIKQAGDYE